MKNTLGLWALISMMGLGLLNACGNGEKNNETATTAQLADLKEGEDVFSPPGLWNGNLKCNHNKTIEDCADGTESGGLRFESKPNSFWGAVFGVFAGKDLGRSGCTFRGKDENVKCRVSCDRISNSLALGKYLCDSQADGCTWNEDESKCEKDRITELKTFFARISSFVFNRSDINDLNDLYKQDYGCSQAGKTCKGVTGVGTKQGCSTRVTNKCLSSCSRIKEQYLCLISSGCTWSNGKCTEKE